MSYKDRILGLIDFLEKPLKFYEDPVYTSEEKEHIKEMEVNALHFFNDVKKDGYITLMIPEHEKMNEDRMIRFSKITFDISNKLVKTREFNAEEGWFILLSLYCWNCEMIKNLLLSVAKKIYQKSIGEKWTGFMTLGKFMKIVNKYKDNKHTSLFLDIDVDLRNSFSHGRIDFTNDEIEYNTSEGVRKRLHLADFLSKYKKLPPLYATLFIYRRKVFVNEIRDFAKRKGYL